MPAFSSLRHIFRFALLSLIVVPSAASQWANNTYDYIVVGSGPGGGPLAAKVAEKGYSVLLIEAGDDQENNLNELVAAWGGNASNDPKMRWDFFVKYHSDPAISNQYEHMTWRTREGKFYVGLNPPAGAEQLGVYYPRAGTLGGCATHNAIASALGSNRNWDYIAEVTGDNSWSHENMTKYFMRLENNHYLPKNTSGHGFNGYLDISLPDPELLANQTGFQDMLRAVAKVTGQNPDDIHNLVRRDINNDAPDHDQQTGIFSFPGHMTPDGRRVTSANPIRTIARAMDGNGQKKYKLSVQLNSLATRVLFSNSTTGTRPRAIGVEFLEGQSMYAADPRYSANKTGTLRSAYASKEVIISGGTFNSPQILKLSGVGPAAELKKFNIPVVVDLPGVGTNMQDNYEIGHIAVASSNFASVAPLCTYGAPGDPCLEMWQHEGKGPYASGPADSVMYKTSNAAFDERDLFMWTTPGAFRGFWPAENVNDPRDFALPPTTWDFSMAKINPTSRAGTVNLRSANPRDVPDINFRFFEDGGEADLAAMEEGLLFARKAFGAAGAPYAPWTEVAPCNGTTECDIKHHIRTQAWSHHATSSCSIGGDDDPMAVLDSRFRVRGTMGLRVVDASAFPRIPGAFPVLPTFILSEKATEAVLEDAAAL
ncbi:GMC oxidoreductase [Patellaria atrata CBS 101060]|uniref:GMC oxidoreductase n=1 Tax=Patellaria atrata CBS 101060 TaxID=1346257 RepID=A0A9P4SDZ6_9PEZI|nr:GMC oxidoreductase [Patellaria atrata CBS 101060]